MPQKPHFLAVGIEVQIEFKGIEDRFKTRVVGFEPGRFLILKTPIALSRDIDRTVLVPGAELVARYLLGGTVWGFRTRVLRKIADDLGLILVEFPEKVENHDLRQAERVETRIPCKLRQGDVEVDALALDLSHTGARVVYRLDQEFQCDPGCEIVLELPYVAPDEPAALTCLVRSMRKGDDRCTLGLQFKDSGENQRAQIEEYLRKVRECAPD